MSPFSRMRDAIVAVSERAAEAQRRRRASRVIASLPSHILKDIGWPAELRQPRDLTFGRS